MDAERELLDAPEVVVEPTEDETTFIAGEEVDTESKELQQLYQFFAEKLGQRIAQAVVWEGAAKNDEIKRALKDIKEDNGSLDEEEASAIANLFSSYLDSEEEMKECYLPVMRTIATAELEEFAEVAVFLLMMLLEKVPENGTAVVGKLFQDKPEVYYSLMGDAVRFSFEGAGKMPPVDQILTADEFKELLVQKPGKLGADGTNSWVLLLGYCPESVLGQLPELLDDMQWEGLIGELSYMMEGKGKDVPPVVLKAKEHLLKVWGTATTLEERKATLQELKRIQDHKEFEKTLELLMLVTVPLDDLQGEEDQPCLVVECPTLSLAMKLFQHTMNTLGDVDVEATVEGLVEQKAGDSMLAAIIRELAGQQKFEEDTAEDLLSTCATENLILSCAELLQVVPNPRTHPFMEMLEGSDEKMCHKALDILNPDLYAPNCTDDTNALHHTATVGFTAVSKEILARGFHRLLGEKGLSPVIVNDRYGHPLHPASMAVQTAHFATAKELLQAMEQSEAKELLTHHKKEAPEIDLHHAMEEATKGFGGRWDEKAREEGEWKSIPQKLEKKEIQERVDFIQTALDTTIDGRYVDLTILLTDKNGQVPDHVHSGRDHEEESDFGEEPPEDEKNGEKDKQEGAKKKLGKVLYRKIAQSEFEDLKSHECFATLTTIIWTDYGIVQGILFSLYLLFMAFLTTSLVLAARSSDPSEYDDPLDWFRLFCEIITFLWILVDLVLEIYELGRVIYKSLKKSFTRVTADSFQESNDGGSDSDSDSDSGSEENNEPQEVNEEKRNCCLALITDILLDYLLDWQNILDDVAILCILLIIPFRILETDVQWVFAALAFMFHGLRIFKYAIMFKSVGEYVAILVLLIKRDVPQFVTVFLVIIFSLGGALYFALTGNYNDANIDTENNNDTSEIYLLWWTGIRILVEGGVLTYYGPGGFNWLGVLIYWLFLFVVTVVLLNILIAQFSKSYEEETERAQINVILTRTKIILKTEQSVLTRPLVKLIRTIRTKLTRTEIDYSRVERLHLTGERDESKPANSEQVEELQTQTTSLGLQLRKQLDGTSDNIGKSVHKMETQMKEMKKMKSEVEKMVADTRQALQNLQSEVEGKLVGLERAVLDTRHYAEDIKQILMTMKKD